MSTPPSDQILLHDETHSAPQHEPALPPRPLEPQDDIHGLGGAEYAPQAPGQEPPNPAIAGLKAMFPDFDDIVLQSVLDSVNGNQDAAVDVLLGMSDPSYVSTHHVRPAFPPPKIRLQG